MAIEFVAGPQIAGTEVIDIYGTHWIVLKDIKDARAQPREGQYYTRVLEPVIVAPVVEVPKVVTMDLNITDFQIDKATDKISFKIMAESTSANIQITVSQAGTYTGVLQVTAGGVTTEQVVEHTFKPDPTPVEPPVNPYPPQTLYLNVTPPALSKPSYLGESIENAPYYTTTAEPTAKVAIRRMTDKVVFNQTNPRFHYSKTGPINCNMTRMFVARKLLEWPSGKIIREVPNLVGVTGPKWSHSDPDLMYGISNRQFFKVVPSTNVRTVIKDFAVLGYTVLNIGGQEGNLSRDDRYVVFQGVKGGVDYVISYDIQTNTILAEKTFAAIGGTVDHSSVSPLGNYIYLQRTGIDHAVYDLNLNYLRSFSLTNGISHASLGIDQAGNEVLVYLSTLGYAKLSDGIHIDLTQVRNKLGAYNGSGSGQTSCENYLRDGWAYISMASGRREIMAVKLDNSGIIEMFGSFRNNGPASGDDSIKGCPSPDGTVVCVNGMWAGDTEVLGYVYQRKI